MAYTEVNYPTKKALKDAVARGEQVRLRRLMFPEPENGTAWVEGPQYPEPHRWYAEVRMVDGFVVWVK